MSDHAAQIIADALRYGLGWIAFGIGINMFRK